MDYPLPPPFLVDCSQKKITFVAASLIYWKGSILNRLMFKPTKQINWLNFLVFHPAPPHPVQDYGIGQDDWGGGGAGWIFQGGGAKKPHEGEKKGVKLDEFWALLKNSNESS